MPICLPLFEVFWRLANGGESLLLPQAKARLGFKRLSSASVKLQRCLIYFVLRESCRAGV